MPTQITQIDDSERQRTIFRIEGEMMIDDALLLERIAASMQSESGNSITFDLADLDFLDSDSAQVLKRLVEDRGCLIEGMTNFLQTAVNDVERIPG